MELTVAHEELEGSKSQHFCLRSKRQEDWKHSSSSLLSSRLIKLVSVSLREDQRRQVDRDCGGINRGRVVGP